MGDNQINIWFEKVNLSFVSTIDSKSMINTKFDEELVEYVIINNFSESSWSKMKKMIEDNQTRNRALDWWFALSEQEYATLLAIICYPGNCIVLLACALVKITVKLKKKESK